MKTTNLPEEIRNWGYRIVDRIADYYEHIEEYPVRSQVEPGDLLNRLPVEAPLQGESLEQILEDFDRMILPGITHWQSPKFFAYFPANSSLPSFLGEMLTAALGAQCMKWETSPAAAELEQRMMEWLRDLAGIPSSFEGVIQDSASSSTLCAILTAREKYSDWKINASGFSGKTVFRVYCSGEAHSSVEKAVKIAGIGRENLVRLPVDEAYRLDPAALQEAIAKDRAMGYAPLCVVAALGTTGSTAIDPLPEIAEICHSENVWLHVDAAMAGSALILPEYRWMIQGIEKADSIVFNPHKWLFTNFDCSAYFIKDRSALVNTFAILPEYLRTRVQGKVNDYSDWGIPLGRRFRALKLWFVLRYYGLEGLQQRLREHISMAAWFENKLRNDARFEIMAPRTINLVCFRVLPKKALQDEEMNSLNERLLQQINKTGKIYLSHTKLKGRYTLRLVVGQTYTEQRHVEEAWEVIRSIAEQLTE